MVEKNCDGENDWLNECNIGMWSLITIPGFAVIMAIIVTAMLKVCKTKENKDGGKDGEKGQEHL